MAKRNYEALNEQLIEELPHFIQLTQTMINHTVTVLVQLQYRFHTTVHSVLERLVDLAAGPLSSDGLQETHSRALAEVAGQLISLTIVPTSLAINYPSAMRSADRHLSSESSLVEGDDSLLSTSSEIDMDSITEVHTGACTD